MPSAFALEVTTPERSLWAGPATSLVVRTAEGYLTVLDGHTSLIASLELGEVLVEPAEGPVVRLVVFGGFLQVDTSPGAAEGAGMGELGDGPIPGLSTRVTLLAGLAELVDEIDRAQAAEERGAAEARLQALRAEAGTATAEGAEDPVRAAELAEAEAALVRADLRVSLTSGGATG
jgi:F-type H+-transporting ATPase subunit epsilon